MSKFPIKISPCPIIETNIEIRFIPNFPPDAVIGVIYSTLSRKGKCSLIQRNVMQLPSIVRMEDGRLKYQPTHTISTSECLVHVGPFVAIIQPSGKDYPGWVKYREIIDDIISLFRQINLVKQIDSIGLKYINFFEFDIFDQINVSIKGLPTPLHSTVFRTELKNDKFVNILQITNGIHVKNPFFEKDGSLIDITTAILANQGLTMENIMTRIEDAKNGEKELFFSLLKKDYLIIRLCTCYIRNY